MNYIIKNSKDLVKRSDVKYNLKSIRTINDYWLLEDLKEVIVRDPMCYGFQYCAEGIPLIRISDLRQPFIDYSNIAYISKNIHNKFTKTHLEKMDILMSVRGVSIGKIGIYLGEYNEANISPNIIIIILKDKELAPYICMFLIASLGQEQIKRFIAGSSKPTITAPLINAIKIPKTDKQFIRQINQIFWDTYKINCEAVPKESKAQDEIRKICCGLEYGAKLTYDINLSEEQRWDPHFHNPKYQKLREGLNRINCSKISDICENISNVVDNKMIEEKIGYIEISSINNLNAQIEEIKVDYIKRLPSGGKIPLKDKYLLIPKVRPYRNANTIYKISGNYICTASKNAFSVYSTDRYNYPYYVLAFLRSYYGVNQIIMYQSGTSYPTVSDEDIKEIKIPVISDDLASRIDKNYKYYMESKEKEKHQIQRIISLINECLI